MTTSVTSATNAVVASSREQYWSTSVFAFKHFICCIIKGSNNLQS